MADPVTTQLQALLDNPREDLGIEIKSWLDLSTSADCATLAKAAIALANHGGGFVVLGLREVEAGGFVPAPNRPTTLVGHTQDVIARVVATYSEPAFQVAVHHIYGVGGAYPVIHVPGGHRTPVQAKKGSPDNKTLIVGRVYVRRPGPQSAEPATAAEWRELIDRCVRATRDDLLDAIRGVLDGRGLEASLPAASDEALLTRWVEDGLARWADHAPKSPTQVVLFPPGFYCVAYRVLSPAAPLAPADLLSAIGRATARLTGWSPWWVPTRASIKPYWKDGAIECFLGEGDEFLKDPAHSDFWRVSPAGEALLIRGFDEDSAPARAEPGKVFDVTLPVWRVGECLTQAARFAEALGQPNSEILFNVRWAGLSGRELKHIEGRRYIHQGRVAQQETFERTVIVRASEVDHQLPEILFDFLAPLYALFDFFSLPKSLVDEEVRRLRGADV